MTLKMPYMIRLTSNELSCLMAKIDCSVTVMCCSPLVKKSYDIDPLFNELCDTLEDLHEAWNEVFLLERASGRSDL